MGKLRTINHPGIELQEIDMSGASEQVGGTTSLVVGFFPQGESGKPVIPTSTTSVKTYFGTPETEAERYAYYACKTVFDNGGNLIAARIPYNNNSQYLTPATKYRIEEWSTANVEKYDIPESAKEIISRDTAVFTVEEVTGDAKNAFYFDTDNTLKIVENNAIAYKDSGVAQYTTVNAVSGATTTPTSSDYYTVENNGVFLVESNVVSGTDSIVFTTYVDRDSLDDSEPIVNEGTIVGYKTFSITVSANGAVSSFGFDFNDEEKHSFSFATTATIGSQTIPVTATISTTFDASKEGKLTVSVADSNGDEVLAGELDVCYPKFVAGFDYRWLTSVNGGFFNIVKHTHAETAWTHGTGTKDVEGLAYNETVFTGDGIDKRWFLYDATVSSPVTATVDAYEGDGLAPSMAIKAYYHSGDGMEYPEMETDDYLELRLWDNKIKVLSDLTLENIDSFDIIHRTFNGTKTAEYGKVSNPSFKSAPMSSDVTVGYEPSADEWSYVEGVNSETLAIPPTDVFNPDDYPQIAVKDPFGNGPMKVLVSVPENGDTYSPDNFFQFVSPYSSIEDVALNKSQKYSWIHWCTPSKDVEGGKKVLLSRTLGCEEKDIPVELSEITNVVSIHPDVDANGFIPLETYQDYRDEAKKPEKNTIVIANITEQKFGSDIYNNGVVSEGDSSKYDYPDEVLGIVPVLMGGFQALPRQSRIELPDGITNAHIFNAIEAIKRGSSITDDPAPEKDHVDIKAITLNPDGFVRELGTMDHYDAFETTYSNQLVSTVPAIDLNPKYKPNGAKVNYVTLAVCQLSLSKVDDNKVALTVLETFTGSLDPTAKGEDGKTSMFIDDIVNNDDSGSTYVRLFSNYVPGFDSSETVTPTERVTVAAASNDTTVTVASPASMGTKLWWTKAKPSMTLGFTEEQTKKYISYATIVATMENVFDTLSNVDEADIDIVVDAGISTIANYIKHYCDLHPEETKTTYDVFFDKINGVDDIAGWKSMCSKMTTFCQTTRKDCITLIDAPRSLCVKDNVKLVQPGGKYSVDYDILPKFNYLGGINSSYAAGYCDWFLAVDDFTSKNVWIPPSIAAEGAVIFTDYNSNYWMPPAGQNRGNVLWAVDIAFNPNSAQQDSIYSKGWNYAINSSGNIMVWGQKTMLNSTSSFNRINIRRLFCRLERMTRKNSKWVIFEINNERTRNIYLDRIDPIFANVKAMGGIYDYRIIVDGRVNTPSVVANNEFRAAFEIKPEHAAEFILLTFFNLNQDMDFSELDSLL